MGPFRFLLKQVCPKTRAIHQSDRIGWGRGAEIFLDELDHSFLNGSWSYQTGVVRPN